jgi:predicted ATPase
MRNQTRAALSDVVVDQIYDRTGGVPLFVEEFTKMVQESGALEQAPATATSTWLRRQIPATLQDLVMARLDRMEGEREIAQLAATLGRDFSYELLSAVADLDEPTLQRDLEELVRAEILYAKGRPPHSSYTFKHALLEDALYNALVKEKRQQFHRRIGEVLKTQFPQTADTRPELLAHHFTEAGLIAEGVEYWLKAGIRSGERSAHHEAIGHLTTAARLLETLEDTTTRDEMELRVLGALAPDYIAVRGYAAPEAGPILNRAREALREGRRALSPVRDSAGDVGVAPGTRRHPDVHRPRRRTGWRWQNA